MFDMIDGHGRVLNVVGDDDVDAGLYVSVLAEGTEGQVVLLMLPGRDAEALGVELLRVQDGAVVERRDTFGIEPWAVLDRGGTIYLGATDGAPLWALLRAPLPPAGDRHAWHLYVVRLAEDAGITRDAFVEHLFAAGIGVSVHYIPLHLHPYWRDRYGLRPEQFPHSQHAYERMLTLPLYTRMTDADVERVVAAVRAALR